MKKVKRQISIVLVLATLFSLIFTMHIAAENSYKDPSVVLLESMLNGNRKWVIETIVEDNRSNNPYAQSYSSTQTSLMKTALSQYENINDPNYRVTYTVMVDLLTKYFYENSWDDDITAGLVDLTAEIIELFGDGENALSSFLGDIKKTTEEEKFEAILEGVFTDTYTSSWNESINEQEASLQQLSTISNSISKFESVANYWSALYGISDDENATTILDYQKKVINPLISSGKNYLKAFDSMTEGEKAASSTALAGASALAVWNWSASHSTTYSGITPITTDLLDMVAGDKAIGLIKSMSDACSFATSAINQFTFLNSLCQQSDLFHDTLMRISNQALTDGHSRMSNVLANYADQMDDVLYENQLQYNLLVDQIAQTSTIQKNLKISSALKAGMPSSWKDAYKKTGFGTMTKVFSVGMFAVDEATGIKNTCIKLSELKYLREMINEAKKVYYSDLAIYQSSQTSSNAQKVLNDLLFLQRLRLRGENIAYKMTKGQLDSGIGKLLSGYSWQDFINQEDTTEAQAWKKMYQLSIDCLIGASLNPVSYEPFQVNSGDTLTIFYDNTIGSYRGSLNGTLIYEMQYRIMSGIEVNGGSLILFDVSVPCINVRNGSVSIDASTVKIGELTQSGSMELLINNEDLVFETCLELSNTAAQMNGYSISSPDITFIGSNTFDSGIIKTTDLHLKNGTVDGMVYCTGNVDVTTSGTVSSLTMNGTSPQVINGSLTVGDLTLDNTKTKGISAANTLIVSGLLSDQRNIVDGIIQLTNTADIRDETVASDIHLDGTSLSSDVIFSRSLTVTNGASLQGGTVKGSMTLTSGIFSNEGKPLSIINGMFVSNATVCAVNPITAYENSYFNNTLFEGPAQIELYGDTIFASGIRAEENAIIDLYGSCTTSSGKDTNHLSTLNLCGTTKQSVGFGGTVDHLTIANSSLFGVEMTENTYVTNTLNAQNQRISIGNNLILTKQATAQLDNVSGHLQIQDWNGTGFSGLNGTLYSSGDNTISGDIIVEGGIRQTEGSISLNNATVSCVQSMECSGSWNIDPESALICSGDAYIGGQIVNEGILEAKELTISGTVSGEGTISLFGDLISKKENTFGTLLVCGNSKQTISGSSIHVSELNLDNESFTGITFEGKVYVTNNLHAQNQRIYSGENIILTNQAIAELDNVTGNLQIQNWDGELISGLRGTMYASGENVIRCDMEFRGGIRQTAGNITLENSILSCQNGLESSGTWTIGEGSSLIVDGDMIATGSIVNLGRFTANDTILKGQMSGTGILDIKGDLTTETACSIGTLVFSGKTAQNVSGSTFTTTDLLIENPTQKGVTFQSPIYVTGNFENLGRIHGTQPLQLTDGTVFDTDAVIAAFHPEGDVVIGENVTLTVNGDAVFSGLVQLSEGAQLIVLGDLVGSSSSMDVVTGSNLWIRGDLRLTNSNLTCNGAVTVWRDTDLSGGTVLGSGSLILNGDLNNKSTISGLGTLTLSGKVPQTISGNEIHTACVIANNGSTSGIALQTTVYYTDELQISESCTVAADKFVEESK